MARKLKVYRTPIGFHDAYVAAPSQAAALRAWGTDRNLFARDAAEEVTDPDLTVAPLAAPGSIIKVMRESTEQEEEEPPAPPAPGSKSRNGAPKRKHPPRPRRDILERAEYALEQAQAARDTEISALTARIDALEAERRKTDLKHDAAHAKLEKARAKAESSYEAALNKWRKRAP